jgi:hypothetical protein
MPLLARFQMLLKKLRKNKSTLEMMIMLKTTQTKENLEDFTKIMGEK